MASLDTLSNLQLAAACLTLMDANHPDAHLYCAELKRRHISLDEARRLVFGKGSDE